MNIRVNWRALIVVLALGVMIAWGLRSLQGSPEADFTPEEQAMLERLEPILDTLVLQREDLSLLPSHFEPCEGGDHSSLLVGSRGDAPDLEDMQAVDYYDAPARYSSFCDSDSGAFVSSDVALPYDKEHLLFWTRVHDELGRADNDDALHALLSTHSDEVRTNEEVVDSRWILAPAFGDSRYAWARTVQNQDTGQRFESYHIELVRGVTMSGVLVKVPSHATAEEEALVLAQTLDHRIAARLESLAAEVHAQ